VKEAEVKGEKTTLVGAIVSGVLASACCVGPLVVVLLGLGSDSFFVALTPYRPLFALLTLSLVGWAWWRHWRAKKRCALEGCTTKRPLLLWLLGGFSVLLLILPELLPYLIQ